MNKLEEKRKEKKLSRKELAKRAGITYEAIRHYEQAKREPKAMILKKIAAILECRIEDLI